jgi:hypothetical protein
MQNQIFDTGRTQVTPAVIPEKSYYKKAFENFINEEIIGNWFAGTNKMMEDYGKTRELSNIRVARFKLELDYCINAGYLHMKVIDYEYEDIEIEDTFFGPFEHEVHHTRRAEVIIPHPHTNSGWLDTALLKRAFMKSFELHWPLGVSTTMVILRMPAEEVIERLRTTDLGGAPKDLRFGGWSLRVEPFRKENGSLYGVVRLLTLPVKDRHGNNPGFQKVVEWDAKDWDAKLDLADPRGNLNEKVVLGLRRELRALN